MYIGPEDHPYKIYAYERFGNGVVFNSRFTHQYVYADEGTIKIAFLAGHGIPNQVQNNYVPNWYVVENSVLSTFNWNKCDKM